MNQISLRPHVQCAIALAAVTAVLAASIPQAQATTYGGNSNTGFGGTVGNGSLTLTDDSTTISGTFTQGASSTFDNVLVLFIDSVSGGFSDTASFSDVNDGLRKAISGYTADQNGGGPGRSTLTFDSGFSPDYAIALGPVSDSFGGLWQLAAGGSGSLIFVDSVGLSGIGNGAAGSYTFSFDLAEIGITAGDSFALFGTYISNSGYRSDEALAGNATGTLGWNPFTQTAYDFYTTTPIPEPAATALVLLGAALLWSRRRR